MNRGKKIVQMVLENSHAEHEVDNARETTVSVSQLLPSENGVISDLTNNHNVHQPNTESLRIDNVPDNNIIHCLELPIYFEDGVALEINSQIASKLGDYILNCHENTQENSNEKSTRDQDGNQESEQTFAGSETENDHMEEEATNSEGESWQNDGETTDREEVSSENEERTENEEKSTSNDEDTSGNKMKNPDDEILEPEDADKDVYGPLSTSESETEQNDEVFGKRKRSKKQNVDQTKWKRNKNKLQRMKGEAYTGFTRSKEGIWKNKAKRSSRQMAERCSGHGKKCTFKCNEFSDIERENLFNNYWKKLDWGEKKIFVINHVKKAEPKRHRSESEGNKKKISFSYYFKRGEVIKQVCKKMFLGTLAIGEWSVRNWCLNSTNGIATKTVQTKRCAESTAEKKSNDRKAHLEKWLDKLPKLPSHYCRKETTKVYIEDNLIKSKSQLYRLYVNDCNSKGLKNLSTFVFDEIFEKKNIGIFKPKKDQCDTCCSFKTGNSVVTEIEYQLHISNKDRARMEKEKDKKEAVLDKCHVITMDLEAVQLCPRLYASALYFKQKLRVHNFTLYNLATHQSTCYWWHEGEGGVEASNFVSCILHYLKTQFSDDKKPVVIYSDGCGYQNRNLILSNALLAYAAERNIVIEQKYLEKGHTQMECDTVHNLIERELQRREVKLPGEFVSVTKRARQKPFPLDAEYLTYEFFNDYKSQDVQWYSSIRPGKCVGDPQVCDIRALRYTPEGLLYFKTDFDAPYECFRKNKNIPKCVEYPKLYNSKPKISNEKYQHLLEITKVMEPDYYHFYQNLPCHNKK